MRIWEKNYFYAMAIFAILLFSCIFLFVYTSFTTAVDAARETAIHDEYHVAKAISTNIAALEKRGVDTSPAIQNVTSPYGDHYLHSVILISVFDKQTNYYSSFSSFPDQTKSLSNAMICRIVSLDEQKYILITDKLQEPDSDYWLAYAVNIGDIYQQQNSRALFLVSIGAAAYILLALGLFFTMKRLYRPVNNLAHELRTPLTAISGYAQYLLIAAATQEERYTAAKYIVDESRRLADITDKLLIMAGLRNGNIVREKVDIAQLFENTKMTFKSVEYRVQQQYFKGDRTLLQSLINNLVLNAVNASENNQKVLLCAYNNTIEVTDSGKGLPDDLLVHINRSNDAVRLRRPVSCSKNGGNGLGIALCHQIAQLHHAKLIFESEAGKGTTARITFTTR